MNEDINNNQNSMSFGVPMAIVIAGAIIAISIFITKGGSENSGEYLVIDQPYAKVAESVGVDIVDFQACMEDREYDSVIDRDAINAVDTGGSGTPWSLVVTESGSVYHINGAEKYDVVTQVIELALSDQEAGIANEVVDEKLLNFRPISENDHIYGNKDAKVTVIEYSDFECPFCRSFHPVVERAVNSFDGEVNWVYRHFPLEAIHPNARNMAHASECVAELGGNDAFWAFSDQLFGIK